MTAAPDFKKHPWKHPAVWQAHAVTKTRDSRTVSIATCECGWSHRVELGRTGAGYVAQDDAIDAHWQSVIAAAAKVPA
jgi:hypothetical protein